MCGCQLALYGHIWLTSGADFNFTYIIGGDDRFGVSQKDASVLSVTYGF